MRELEALNKMLGVIFAYGPSKEKKKKNKKTPRAKKLKASRKSNA
jgi:hypothetical protein